MRYKHIKTRAIIDSPSKIVGKAWQLIDDVKQDKTENNQVENTDQEDYVEEEINLEEMTNRELEAFAKEHDIELTTDDKRNKPARIAAIAKAFEED